MHPAGHEAGRVSLAAVNAAAQLGVAVVSVAVPVHVAASVIRVVAA